MTTTAALLDLLPSDDDVAAYQRDGFFVTPPVLPEALLDQAEEGMDAFYEALELGTGAIAADPVGWIPADGDRLRKNDYASLKVPGLAALAHSPVVGAIAARLAGATEIRLWHDQLLFKPAGLDTGAANVGWHTDRQYWVSCSSDDMLTAWIPFHDCDERVGGVTFVRGSHRWPTPPMSFFDPDLDGLEDKLAGRAVEKVTPVLPRGSMTFHHCRTIHGSGPNLADHPRRSIAVHLQPGDNRYIAPSPLPDGRVLQHANESRVRRVDGAPDFSDPAVCPTLWPAADVA